MRAPGMSACFAVAMSSMVMAAAPAKASAQETDIDPVHVFNEVCYSKVPAVQAIRDMATRLAWNPIAGGDLERFTQHESPDVLEGWDMQVGERLFRLGITQSRPVSSMIAAFPEFAEGTATTCTLVLDGQDDAETITERMKALAGKEPASRAVPEGELKTTTWAGGNDDFKVFLFAKTDATGRGGLLNVTILSKQAN